MESFEHLKDEIATARRRAEQVEELLERLFDVIVVIATGEPQARTWCEQHAAGQSIRTIAASAGRPKSTVHEVIRTAHRTLDAYGLTPTSWRVRNLPDNRR